MADEDSIERQDGEQNVYSEEVREDLVESGEISPMEEGFMAGYEEAEEDDEDKMKDPEELDED